MKLYFGNTVTTVTTLTILSLLTFIGHSVYYRDTVTRWGLRSAVLLVFGLLICCFAAARDGLDKTIQHAVDGSCAPGIFPLVSIPNLVGCVGALLILIAPSQRRSQGRKRCGKFGFTSCRSARY